MSGNVTLRLAQRSDIHTLTRIANAANSGSAVHRRMAPLQDKYPWSHYHWRLNLIRERFVQPDLRTIVAVDTASGEILGFASWAVEGSETALYKKWVGESTWADWLESKLVWIERKWCKHTGMDSNLDPRFADSFVAAMQGKDQPVHPDCLCAHLICVDPETQSRGVGRMLLDWAKDLAVKEDLPLFLEANLEATGFYEKTGFSRLTGDMVVSPEGRDTLSLPVFVWEGRQREGRWLERDVAFDGPGERWKLRDVALLK